MESTHILVVANRTAATPRLLEEVNRRVERGPCRFSRVSSPFGGEVVAGSGRQPG